jgi:hypothetical protein
MADSCLMTRVRHTRTVFEQPPLMSALVDGPLACCRLAASMYRAMVSEMRLSSSVSSNGQASKICRRPMGTEAD